MKTTRFKNNDCPSCGFMLNAADGVNHGEAPMPGDITICINCTELLEFSDDMSLVKLSDDKKKGLSDEETKTINYAVNAIKTTRGWETK